MPLKLTRRVPTWDGNIVGGNTVTLRLPIGLTYHQVYTEYTFSDGAPLALADAVNMVRLIANGKPIWELLASELDTKNQFESRAQASGILTLDFDRFNMRTRSAEELTSLGSGFGSFSERIPSTTEGIPPSRIRVKISLAFAMKISPCLKMRRALLASFVPKNARFHARRKTATVPGNRDTR